MGIRPTGGYGMNTAVGDSFDIAWKVAAASHGYGGRSLLQSYEDERRPVGMKNIERSGVHWNVHVTIWDRCGQSDGAIFSASDKGVALREELAQHIKTHDNENKDHGLELGYRYKSDVIVLLEDISAEPPWLEKHYTPSTWPGARAPHVYLKDGVTSIFDLFGQGPEWTLVDFSQLGDYIKLFQSALASLKVKIPCRFIHLPDEVHARKVWERDAVLVRPDDHVAWRSSLSGGLDLDADKVLLIATGQTPNDFSQKPVVHERKNDTVVFTSTVGNVEQSKVEQLAAFQK